jgi:hypothetical protein
MPTHGALRPLMPRGAIVPGAIALLLVFLAQPAYAGPDFSQSKMVLSPEKASEGDLVTMTVTVTNSGNEDSPYTTVALELPLEAMFVDMDGFPESTVDPSQKVISGQMNLPVGASSKFSVRLIVPKDAGGRLIAPDLIVTNYHLGAQYYGHEVFDIDTRVTQSGIVFGGYRVTKAGIVTVAVLLLFPVLWLVIAFITRGAKTRHRYLPRALRRRVAPASAAFAIVIAIGFWTMFAAMAMRDWNSKTTWRETTCEITDSRLREENAASLTPDRSPVQRTRPASRVYKPLLALRYDANGHEMISTGFDTGSYLSVGGPRGTAADAAQWSVGDRVPCWYNPDDPSDVVVRNGFGGAYLFALFPLPVALFGLYQVRALIRGRE